MLEWRPLEFASRRLLVKTIGDTLCIITNEQHPPKCSNGHCPKTIWPLPERKSSTSRNSLGCSSGRCPMTNGPLPQQNAEDFALDSALSSSFPPSSPPPPHSASIHTIEGKGSISAEREPSSLPPAAPSESSIRCSNVARESNGT